MWWPSIGFSYCTKQWPLIGVHHQCCWNAFTHYNTNQEQAPVVHLTKLLTQLEKAVSCHQLLTRPTSFWVNLQLINRGRYHFAVTASAKRTLCIFSNVKQQTQITGNDYYIPAGHECTDVTNHSRLMGTSKACVVKILQCWCEYA